MSLRLQNYKLKSIMIDLQEKHTVLYKENKETVKCAIEALVIGVIAYWTDTILLQQKHIYSKGNMKIQPL